MSESEPGLILRSWRASKVAWWRTVRPARETAGYSRPILPRQKQAYVIVALACLLIALCMVFLDRPVIEFTRPFYLAHEGLVRYFKQITKLGSSGWILLVSGALALYLSTTQWSTYRRRERMRLINLHADTTFVFFTTLFTGTSIWIIKNAIGRARPRLLEEFGHLYFDFGAFQAAFASFPSGHSTTFGTIGMAMALLMPKHRSFWICFGVLGASTRILVGAHYPSDAVSGLIYGAACVLLWARFLAQRGTMFRFNGGFIPDRVRLPSKG